MAKLDHLIEELVTANRILAREGVVDSFGHISVRHPDDPRRYLLSRSRAPDCIENDDIMAFTLEGEPVDAKGRAPYLERFIHGALYEARPDARLRTSSLGWVDARTGGTAVAQRRELRRAMTRPRFANH